MILCRVLDLQFRGFTVKVLVLIMFRDVPRSRWKSMLSTAVPPWVAHLAKSASGVIQP